MTVVAALSPAHTGMPQGLARECQVLGAFIDLLQREQRALIACDSSQLVEFAAQKSALAKELHGLEQQRASLLQAENLPTSAEGMRVWIAKQAKSDPDRNQSAAWKDLQLNAARARSLNEINGKLIAAQLNHYKNQIDALHSAAFSQQVYDASGATRCLTHSRTLTAA
jgi:flagellar biosynthesis protein FlgN